MRRWWQGACLAVAIAACGGGSGGAGAGGNGAGNAGTTGNAGNTGSGGSTPATFAIAFSPPSQTFMGELQVSLSTGAPGYEIRYTTL
jgi:hypothetical protein